MTSTGLFIFRRDFRISDNTSLNILSKKVDVIIPIFIITPGQVKNNTFKSSNSIQFMYESLIDLNKNLRNKLVVVFGKNENVIKDIIENNENIVAIGYNKDYTQYSKVRDEYIEKISNDYDIEIISHQDYTIFSDVEINGKKEYYSVFNPFYKKCISHDLPKTITNKTKFSNAMNCKNKKSLDFLTQFFKKNNDIIVNGGRKNALKILSKLHKFKNYEKIRNLPQYNTTLLSAYIKYGCVSIREVYLKMIKSVGLNSELTRQLIWHDFYAFLMKHLPSKQTIGGGNFKNKTMKWNNNKKNFKLWCNGQTGIPIIDAGMRQLNKTGWMHNRVRLLVSNFLIKKLKIDWHWGEKYFATKLVDYDVSSNNLNWQWSAGVGTDRTPYERIYNPFKQTKDIDSECVYIKRYIPELKNVDNNIILNWDKEYQQSDIKYANPLII